MYEILYIIPAPFSEKDLPEITKKINKLIEDFGGKIIEEKNLGSRKLAYQIKQATRGFYILVNFEMEPTNIKELEKKLKLTSEVLRYLITTAKIRIKKAPVAKKEEVKKEEGVKKEPEKVDLDKLGEKIDDLFKM